MLSLRKYFESLSSQAEQKTGKKQEITTSVAICVILLEVAHADAEFSSEEKNYIIGTLSERYDLSEDESQELVEEALQAREESLDMFKFTKLINESYDDDQKWDLLVEVWRVILADGILDAHEDYLAHKLARLMNLKHQELIEAKLTAKEEIEGDS